MVYMFITNLIETSSQKDNGIIIVTRVTTVVIVILTVKANDRKLEKVLSIARQVEFCRCDVISTATNTSNAG